MQEVQDGRGSYLEGPLASRGLDSINRPKGCLLICEHGSTRLEIAPVQLPALWPQQCPSSVYKAAEACNCIAASEEPPPDIVPGRHVADGSVQSRVESIREVSPTAPAAVGVQHQLGQICSLPYTEDSIPRVMVNSVEMSMSLPREKVAKISQACRATLRQPSTTV